MAVLVHRTASALSVAISVAQFAGCTPEQRSDPNVEEWHSQHFVYRASKQDPSVCPAIVSSLETHFSAIHQYLGLREPAEKIRYHKFQNLKELKASGDCSPNHDACYFAESGVQTAKSLELHELVHAYLKPLGDSHQVLEEGLAEALSCAGRSPAPEVSALTAERLFAAEAWSTSNPTELSTLYAASARLVAELIRRKGTATFLSFFSNVRRGASLSAIELAFKALYGEPLTETWSRLGRESPTDTGCLRVWECAAPALNQEQWLDVCGSDSPVQTLTLNVESLVTQESDGFGFLLGSCESDVVLPNAKMIRADLGGNDGELFWLALAPGRYFATRNMSAGKVGLSSEALSVHTSAEHRCEELEPLLTDFKHQAVFGIAEQIVLNDVKAEWTFRFRDLNAAQVALYDLECSPGTNARWCTDCDEASCQRGCDSNVMPMPRAISGEDLVVRMSSSGEADSWIRISRSR